MLLPLRPVLLFLIVLARMGGLVTFAPFWSHRAVTPRVRIVLALLMAFIVLPIVAERLPEPPINLTGLMIVIVGELVIGLALGFVGRVVFSSLETAAQILGFQMGLSLASVIDPATRAQTAALGVIAQMFGLLILLASNGHHWFLAATIKSFGSVAPGNLNLTPSLAELFLRMTADALAVGVALAAPAIIVLLGVELTLAIVGRAAPQIQVMVLSFPIKIAVGLWLLGASLYFLPDAVRHVLGGIRTNLARVLNVM